MAVVRRSHRVLYVDRSAASREAHKLLDELGIEFASVLVSNRASDPRGFTELPAFAYVTRSGVVLTKQGLGDIRAIINAIRSDFLAEREERARRAQRGEGEWDPEELARVRYLTGLTGF